ncbi:MAG: hypothetical protein NTX50_03900 [Candidatus Sumerlaeota bacterium]|nr:hypothetical protein [Candidatus Sumerlaeota bacterium]
MKKPPAISKAAKVAFLLAVATAIISSFPVWYGLARTPEGHIYLWSSDPYDNNTYFAKMRPGYRGEWMTLNLYDCTSRKAVFLYPLHIAMGHAAAVYRNFLKWRAGADPPAYQTLPLVYNATRLASAFALALAVFWLTGFVAPSRPSRRLWITALALFAGGWGRVCNTEANIMKCCILFPHFSFSLVFYVVACGAFLQSLKRPRCWKSSCAGAAAAGFALGWIHPYDVPPLAAIAVAALVWRWIVARRLPATLLSATALFALFASAPILLQIRFLSQEPMYKAIEAQNYLRWAYWWEWFAMLDVYLIAAAFGMAALWPRRRRPEAMFIIVWVVVGVAVLNAPQPVSFPRRMIEGLPIGLAFAAVAGLEAWIIRPLARWRKTATFSSVSACSACASPAPRLVRGRIRRLRHAAFAIVLLALAPRTFWAIYDTSLGADPLLLKTQYIHFEEADAMEWLARNSDWREVVWAGPERGSAIPFLSGNRVFYGHNVETSYSQERLRDTRDLFTGRMPVGMFRAFVHQSGVRYLYVGPLERAMFAGDIAAYDPETLGAPVFQNKRIQIYRLR